ncbi:50S ribosome-binding GTPase [Tabrizicola sp. J26]|uniref:GTPase family protein n=1 Tax=Alitabrizicola rongguiensis TaxID=2909234 RepID=UPI001F3BD5F0|nr:GTPase [Tabrizicola rongguiensis]MCF1708711.1 50S ribosome-binding GTPase [Tabrizicola rongguiensis]
MTPHRKILSLFLRGRVLLGILLYLMPLVVLVALGFLWLAEKGWLLRFVLATVAVIGISRLALWAMSRWARRAARATPGNSSPLVKANPDWTDRELEVFLRLSSDIRDQLIAPLPWGDLQRQAIDVVGRAAGELSGGTRTALDFSIPEALLLFDQVATRLRGDMRSYVPMADTIRISTLVWFWSNRIWFRRGAYIAQNAWRMKRLVANLPVAILQEIQNILLGEATGAIQNTAETSLQRLILEEVARAAIDLHAGHLRFSDAELLEIELESHRRDLAREPEVDAPLRVMVVGQVSAGKTSLINALSGCDMAETDVVPTTQGLVSHQIELSGIGFTFVDSEGIDGSDMVEERLLEQLMQCDLVLWVVRANRPARAPDLALLSRFRESFASDFARRRPRVIVAVNAVDNLLEGWPWAEHLLPPEALAKLAEVVRAVSADLGEPIVLPISCETPVWNIGQLETLIAQEAGEALMVQRNRRRLEGRSEVSGVLVEVGRAGAGARQLGRLLWHGWRDR